MCTELPIIIEYVDIENLYYENVNPKEFRTYVKYNKRELKNMKTARISHLHEIGDIFRLYSIIIKQIQVFRYDEIIPSHKVPMFENIHDNIRLFFPLDDYVYVMIKGKIMHLEQGKLWYVPVHLYHTIFAKNQLILAFDVVTDSRLFSYINLTRDRDHFRKDEGLRKQLLRHLHINKRNWITSQNNFI